MRLLKAGFKHKKLCALRLQSHRVHREVIARVVSDFVPQWIPNARVLFARGQTRTEKAVRSLGRFCQLDVATCRDLPDAVVFSETKNRLFLIEAVHSSGPVSTARRKELCELTKGCSAEIVYVTALLDRGTFRKFILEMAWETNVWFAEDPEHMIQFDGERLLGPYPDTVRGATA